jgi:hypothetical protein
MIHNKYFEIVKEFLRGYFKTIYGRELVGKVEFSQKNIANTLGELEGQRILISNFNGNRRYYSLNFENPLIRDHISFFEKYVKLSFLKKNPVLIDFSSKVSGKIVCVFGSYAKGINKKNSDLDLLVVGGDSNEISQLGKEYGLDVQVFNLSLSDFRKGFANNLILKECLKNHVVLKGENLFVSEVIKWKI